MRKNLRLNNLTVVITGGGSGLGREMALATARAGANVVIAGRRPKSLYAVSDLISDMGRRSLAVPTDVTNAIQVERLFKCVVGQFGKVDVLINNAGMVGDQGGRPIWEITDEEFKGCIDVNLTGAFYCARAVAKDMVNRRNGKIVNVSSVFGIRGGRDNFAYALSKGGIIQLTRTLATSLGRYGITSNCIIPGLFPTEGTESSIGKLPKQKFIPVGRLGRPSELGPIAVLLCSKASDYMNGGMFAVDGGALAGGYAPTGYAPIEPLLI